MRTIAPYYEVVFINLLMSLVRCRAGVMGI